MVADVSDVDGVLGYGQRRLFVLVHVGRGDGEDGAVVGEGQGGDGRGVTVELAQALLVPK